MNDSKWSVKKDQGIVLILFCVDNSINKDINTFI